MKYIILIAVNLLFTNFLYAQVPKDLYGTWELAYIDGKHNITEYRKFKFSPIRNMFISLSPPTFSNNDITLATYGIFTCSDKNKDELQGFYDFDGKNGFILYTFYETKLQISKINIKDWNDSKISADFYVKNYKEAITEKSLRTFERRNDNFYPSIRIDSWTEQTEPASLERLQYGTRPSVISSYEKITAEEMDLKNAAFRSEQKKQWDALSTTVNALKSFFNPSNFTFDLSLGNEGISVSNGIESVSFYKYKIVDNLIFNYDGSGEIYDVYDNKLRLITRSSDTSPDFTFINPVGSKISYFYFKSSEAVICNGNGRILYKDEGRGAGQTLYFLKSLKKREIFEETISESKEIKSRYIIVVNYKDSDNSSWAFANFEFIDLELGTKTNRNFTQEEASDYAKELLKK